MSHLKRRSTLKHYVQWQHLLSKQVSESSKFSDDLARYQQNCAKLTLIRKSMGFWRRTIIAYLLICYLVTLLGIYSSYGEVINHVVGFPGSNLTSWSCSMKLSNLPPSSIASWSRLFTYRLSLTHHVILVQIDKYSFICPLPVYFSSH